MRLGSFVETLMVTSSIPVLTVNERTKVPKKISNIFFPTDFSPASRKALRSVLKWAARFQARVVLYHLMETPTPMVGYDFYWGGPDPRFVEMALEQAEVDCQKTGDKLAKGVRRQGLECEFFLETRPADLGRALLRNAQATHADMIVLTSSRGPFNQTLFGRAMRDVLAGASRPVIVVRA